MKAKWSILLVLTLVMSMFLAACGSGGEDKATTENGEGSDNGTSGEPTAEAQVLNLVEVAELPNMDSTQADDAASFNVMNQVFEGLYRLGPDNTPVPGVAESYEQDGNIITFKLREDAQWSNGTPVTANDFVYSWRKALAPDTLSKYAYIMADVKNANAIAGMSEQGENHELYGNVEALGVKAVDDYTLEVELENAVPYFIGLTSFATFYPQSQEYVESQGDQFALESDTMIYNGPFVMTEWNHGEGWVMKKNDTYWDKDTVKLDTINVKVIKDTATQVNLYETAAIDRATLSAEFVDQYSANDDFMTYGEPTMWYLKFNVDRIPAEMRKAMQRAVDKQGLVDVILNNGSLAANYFHPVGFVTGPDGEDFRAKYGDMITYDVAEAQKHWEAALAEAGTDTVEYELLISDTDTAKKIGEYVKNQLETNLPGLKVTINNQPFKQRLALDDAIDYDIHFSGWGPDYQDPMTFMDMWVTGGGNNNSNYSNPEYDKLIEEAKTDLSDLQVRWEKLQDAEKILLVDDAVLGPIYQRGRAILQKPYVNDLIVHPFGADYSYKWTYVEGKE